MTSPEALPNKDAPRLKAWSKGRRASFNLRYAVAVSLDRGLPDASDSAQGIFESSIRAPILNFADSCCHLPEVDGATVNGLMTGVSGACLRLDASTRKWVEKRLLPVRQCLHSLSHDDGASNGCDEIEVILQSIDAFVAQRYRANCPGEWAKPIIWIEYSFRLAGNAKEPPAVTAKCRAADGIRPASVVDLDVKDCALDWMALAEAPYVLMHEVMAHAYQGVVEVSVHERSDVDAACAWTEGWMDSVAMMAAEQWVKTHRSDPAWIAENRSEILTATRVAYDRRYSEESKLTPKARSRRKAARTAVGRLRDVTLHGIYLDDVEESTLYRFSLILNSMRIPHPERNEIAVKIARALEACTTPSSAFVEDVVGALDGFCEARDIAGLKRALDDLIEAP